MEELDGNTILARSLKQQVSVLFYTITLVSLCDLCRAIVTKNCNDLINNL